MLTWANLLTRATSPFTDQGDLSTKGRDYLIEAQEQFVSKTKCLMRRKWLYISASTEYVALPDDLTDGGDIRRAEFRGTRLEYRDLYAQSSHDYTDLTVPYGSSYMYDVYDGNFHFLPGTAEEGWLCLWYIPTPIVLTDSSTAYSKLSYDAMTQHFYVGETVTGGTSTAYATVAQDLNSRKTGTLVLTDIFPAKSTTVFTGGGVNDIAVTQVANGAILSKSFSIVIDAEGTPDTFKWSDDGEATWTETVAVTGATQSLSYGISISFTGTDNHTLNDKWTFTLTPFANNETLTGSENGLAVANGNLVAFATAGDDPDIPNEYRPHLVSFAKSRIYEDEEDAEHKVFFMGEFSQATSTVRQEIIENRGSGPNVVEDVL